jgi:endonuclease/exonuclease/phosphatase family metal-dependent hydrolase
LRLFDYVPVTFSLVLVGLCGCEEQKNQSDSDTHSGDCVDSENGFDMGNDGNSDLDTDADSDADSDADADMDTDADTDTATTTDVILDTDTSRDTYGEKATDFDLDTNLGIETDSKGDTGSTTAVDTTTAEDHELDSVSDTNGQFETDPDTDTGLMDTCDPNATIEIASFNIRYDGGGVFDPNGWNNVASPRRDRVISLIRDMAPDILGVQEALSNQVDDLTALLPEYGFVGCGRDDGVTAGEYAGVFYRLERFELLDSGFFWLSETPNIPGTVFDGSGSIRMATWIVVLDIRTGQEIFAINTHFDNVSQSSRENSATLIREQIGVLTGGKQPIALTGDFNQSEENAAIQIFLTDVPTPMTRLTDGYRDLFPVRQIDEATYHDFTGDPKGSRIDFILHDARFITVAAEIRRDTYDGKYPSDHFPVTATLAWRYGDNGVCPTATEALGYHKRHSK